MLSFLWVAMVVKYYMMNVKELLDQLHHEALLSGHKFLTVQDKCDFIDVFTKRMRKQSIRLHSWKTFRYALSALIGFALGFLCYQAATSIFWSQDDEEE